MKRLTHPSQLQDWKAHLLSERPAYEKTVAVSSGTCGQASGSLQIIDALRAELEKRGLQEKVGMEITGCHGFCELEPNIIIYPDGIFYKNLETKDIPAIVEKTLLKNRVIPSLVYEDRKSGRKISLQKEIPFYHKQLRLLTEGNFKINPARIEDYILADGYQALAKVLFDMTAEEVIQEMTASGLRGRGGAGLPTGKKWQACHDEIADRKFIVCNVDEGDPGSSMNRSLLEANPHSIIEGMIIGAYAVGAAEAYIFVQREYPLAVRHITLAVEQAQRCGLLGRSILGSEFHLDIHIVLGAGAFISNQEKTLLDSLGNQRDFCRQRPIFPAQEGLWEKRVNINNVETWANVPLIINRGAEWFSKIGTAKSKGTKIFSLAGKIKNTGLVEVPLGIKLKEIIYDIGGGMRDGRKLKAVQAGGASGGCIPAQMLDLSLDYGALTQAGAVLGPGGLVVMDETTCLVDMALYFLEFTQEAYCGKCEPCQDGTKQMRDILSRITRGQGEERDLVELETLARSVKAASLCGLGRSAPNPVLSTLKYFRHEYEAHIREKSCPALVCKDLLSYHIEPEKCTGCLLCLKNCSVGAIRGVRKKVHLIDQQKCNKCGACFDVCPPRISAVSRHTGKKRYKILRKEINARA
jgi:NADH-quinone oxidoreductase subunit F